MCGVDCVCGVGCWHRCAEIFKGEIPRVLWFQQVPRDAVLGRGESELLVPEASVFRWSWFCGVKKIVNPFLLVSSGLCSPWRSLPILQVVWKWGTALPFPRLNSFLSFVRNHSCPNCQPIWPQVEISVHLRTTRPCWKDGNLGSIFLRNATFHCDLETKILSNRGK